ncbi:MAG: hypothetical protein KTR14_10380 [Vampirovibrio sp.]|nr:hypothetical protein [Vampirovibrio sp.]
MTATGGSNNNFQAKPILPTQTSQVQNNRQVEVRQQEQSQQLAAKANGDSVQLSPFGQQSPTRQVFNATRLSAAMKKMDPRTLDSLKNMATEGRSEVDSVLADEFPGLMSAGLQEKLADDTLSRILFS